MAKRQTLFGEMKEVAAKLTASEMVNGAHDLTRQIEAEQSSAKRAILRTARAAIFEVLADLHGEEYLDALMDRLGC